MHPFPILAAALIQYASVTAPVLVPTQAQAPQTVDRWSPDYADQVPGKRRSVAALTSGGVSPLYVADVTSTAPPLSWESTYPDRINKKAAPAWSFTAGTFYPVWEVIADPGGGFVSTGAVPILQYQAIAAPVLVPAEAPVVVPDWFSPQLPSPARQQTVECGGIQQPLYVADVTVIAPSLSWAPSYIDRIRVKRFHAAYQPAYTADRFQAPDVLTVPTWFGPQGQQPVRRRVGVASTTPQAEFGYEVDVPVLSWTGSAPDRIIRRRPVVDRGGLSQPLYVADVTVQAPALSWTPQYRDRSRVKALHASQQQAYARDRFEAPDAVTVTALSWSPEFPDRVNGKAPLRQAVWSPVAPWHVPDVTDPVTPSSWDAVYPDRIAGRASRVQSAQSGLIESTEQAPAFPELSWQPASADVVRLRPRLTGHVALALFVPDVTQPVTARSWAPTYPDRVPGVVSLRTAIQSAWSMDRFQVPDVPPVFVPEGRLTTEEAGTRWTTREGGSRYTTREP